MDDKANRFLHLKVVYLRQHERKLSTIMSLLYGLLILTVIMKETLRNLDLLMLSLYLGAGVLFFLNYFVFYRYAFIRFHAWGFEYRYDLFNDKESCTWEEIADYQFINEDLYVETPQGKTRHFRFPKRASKVIEQVRQELYDRVEYYELNKHQLPGEN